MYKLSIVNKKYNNNLTNIYYDEKYIKFLNNDGTVIDTNRFIKDSKKEIAIKISLGTECNNNCIYCQQGDLANNNLKFYIDNNYIKKYCKSILNLLIDRFKNLEEYNIIFSFWGGEPLLYINYIKALVLELRNIFSFTNIYFNTVTNGILIDDDIIDFLLKYNIGLSLSHDGPGQLRCRNIEILKNDKILKCIIKYIDNYTNNNILYLLPVFSYYNPTIDNYINYLYNFLGEKILNIRIPEISYVKPQNQETIYLSCSKSDIEYNKNLLIKHINGEHDTGLVSLFDPYIDNITRMLFKYTNQTIDNRSNCYACQSSKNENFCFDMNGTAWMCHNYIDYTKYKKYIIGNIFDTVQCKNINTQCIHRHKECDYCICGILCNGGCPLGVSSFDMCVKKYQTLSLSFYNAIRLITNDQYKLIGMSRIVDE